MAPFSIEKQLILNRLGKTSLNKDAVELIKEFTFESWNNWCIRVEAERIKRITNKAIEDMSVMELVELISAIEEKFGVTAAAAVAAAVAATQPSTAAPHVQRCRFASSCSSARSCSSAARCCSSTSRARPR